jgi:hypothetical protein
MRTEEGNAGALPEEGEAGHGRAYHCLFLFSIHRLYTWKKEEDKEDM